MALPLPGFGFAGFRNFAGSIQRLGPLGPITVVSGPNNIGKSNLLRLVAYHLPQLHQVLRGEGRVTPFQGLDLPQGGLDQSLKVSVFLDTSIPAVAKAVAHLRSLIVNRSGGPPLADRFFSSEALLQGSTGGWIDFVASPEGDLNPDPMQIEAVMRDPTLTAMPWREIAAKFGPAHSAVEANVRNILRLLGAKASLSLKTLFIPAFRQTRDGSGAEPDADGSNLVSFLSELQHPPPLRAQLRERFDAIQDLLRTVLGSEALSIEVEAGARAINVRLNGQFLPLRHFGTGVEELMVVATQACWYEDRVMCIEEPEIHLHPLLQQRLFEFLVEHTKNQYLITSHSAKLLDFPSAAIVSVNVDEGRAAARVLTRPADRFELLHSMGYRASDLVQTNAILWVEGPSDRIYLLRFLELLDPTLKEGTHFSILFYGGRLLSHLSAGDAEVEEFISLRRINRNCAILMDSDRDNASSPINATKERICTEFASGSGMAWLSSGREIENYMPAAIVDEAIKASHEDVASIGEGSGPYRRATRFKRANKTTYGDADKVKVAKRVSAKLEFIPDELDLRERLRELRSFIEAAN